jgi:hypothetical protein
MFDRSFSCCSHVVFLHTLRCIKLRRAYLPVNLSSLTNTTPFLNPPIIIRAKLRKLIDSLEPILSDQYECSVPGLGAIMKDGQDMYIFERIPEKEIRSEPNQARLQTADPVLGEVFRLLQRGVATRQDPQRTCQSW